MTPSFDENWNIIMEESTVACETYPVLDSIIIPSSVRSIGSHFLEGGLKTDGSSKVVFLSKDAPSMGEMAFTVSYSEAEEVYNHNISLYFPEGSESSYQTMGDCFDEANAFSLSVEHSNGSVSVGGTLDVIVDSKTLPGFSLSANSDDASVNLNCAVSRAHVTCAHEAA